LSDVFVLANVLNDISNFETGQILVQNNERDVRCKMMAEGKIIDVAVKTTSTDYNNNINHK
jgi:hypothetical protein